MDNSSALKIIDLISRLETIRSNLYPVDWDADPLYQVIRELQQIATEAQPSRGL